MITYYIGNVREKRFLFRKFRPCAAMADNADVLCDFRLNGKMCFVLGDIPYGDMRVGEYLAYARALKTKLPMGDDAAKALLRKVGVRAGVRRKMKNLPRDVFRAVLLAAALNDDTRAVWINYDGVAYSFFSRARIRRQLHTAAKSFEEVHAAVSDYRFIPRAAHTLVAADGVLTEGKCKSASRRYGRLRLRRSRRKQNLALGMLCGRKTLLCDN